MLMKMVGLAAGAASLGAVAVWSVAAAGVDVVPGPVAVAAADPIAEVITEVTSCASGDEGAAQANAASLTEISWSPWGRSERGWETYAPQIAREIGAECGIDSAAFAADLADWQAAHSVSATGQMDNATFTAMKVKWQNARPFVAVRAEGICPSPPTDAQLTTLSAEEGYMGKSVQLRSDVAQAYRAMVAAARAEDPAIAADLEALDVFSGYRSPAYDDARCARDGNCGGVTRAKCSAHRTGYAFDIVVGHAPGHSVDSTNDENRLFMSRTPAYRWLVGNAERFGFVNYVFEPWHWEFVGEPAQTPAVQASAN